jgi:hypothetical protein
LHFSPGQSAGSSIIQQDLYQIFFKRALPPNNSSQVPTSNVVQSTQTPQKSEIEHPAHFSFAILVLFPYCWIHSFKHPKVNDQITGALPFKLPRERTPEQEAWIRIRAN